jgi:Family of unknown function (DUF6325)
MADNLQASQMGPVDVAVIAFERGEFNGDVAPALAELERTGTVRIIDATFVQKSASGTTQTIELADNALSDAFEQVTGSQFDLLSDSDLAEIAGALQPEQSALVLVWENSWASRFARAVRASHGRVAYMERIPHETVERAIAALSGSETASPSTGGPR